MVVAAAPAVAAPIPDYTVSPNPPIQGQPAMFTSVSTPIPPPVTRSVEWDFTASPDFEQVGESVTHTFSSCGPATFRMRVTDPPEPAETRTFALNVAPSPTNRPPVAQFRFSPTLPVVGQEVLFESQSYDPDGALTSFEWDVDGDGFDDGTSPLLAHKFQSAGSRAVRLRVTDDSCTQSPIALETVTVLSPPANKLPVAQFAVSPLRPQVGEQVSLRSFSYDPDGSIVSQRWDLDGDGDFDENINGPTAFTVFSERGERIVRLQVRDSSGAVQTETQNIDVRRRPASPVALINPFPVARLAGSVYPRGVRVTILEVRTPRSSKVVVRCTGKSCPAKRITKTSKRKPVRFKAMARFLRAGTVIKVSIRRSGQIGKHTRWIIRGGKLPKRTDSCLFPGKSKPARCPRP